jgi:hypothetical protein
VKKSVSNLPAAGNVTADFVTLNRSTWKEMMGQRHKSKHPLRKMIRQAASRSPSDPSAKDGESKESQVV